MRVVYRLEDADPGLPYPVATIGNFDGVHLGHERLIRDIVERAALVHGTSMVVTFYPHPLQVLAPDNAPRQIQTLGQKLEIMQGLGVQFMAVVPFTREFARMSAREFAVDVLRKKLGIREIYVGPNFAFGRRREGSFNLLKEIGAEQGFLVGRIHQVHFRGNRVSSTAVRQALIAGQVALARRLLGRPPALEGEIVHGDAIGTGIGVPTANLRTVNELIPRYGVFATLMTVEGRCYKGVTNIGLRPTVAAEGAGNGPSIESHLLDYHGDLYGRKAKLELLLFLREERRFADKQLLVSQISRDIARARRYFRWYDQALAKTATEPKDGNLE